MAGQVAARVIRPQMAVKIAVRVEALPEAVPVREVAVDEDPRVGVDAAFLRVGTAEVTAVRPSVTRRATVATKQAEVTKVEELGHVGRPVDAGVAEHLRGVPKPPSPAFRRPGVGAPVIKLEPIEDVETGLALARDPRVPTRAASLP